MLVFKYLAQYSIIRFVVESHFISNNLPMLYIINIYKSPKSLFVEFTD